MGTDLFTLLTALYLQGVTTGSHIGCPSEGTVLTDSIYNETCYWIVQTKQQIQDGEDRCASNGGHLAVVPSESIATMLYAFITNTGVSSSWLFMGYDEYNEKVTVRHTGEQQLWTYWDKKEPNDKDSLETCIAIKVANGKWHDIPCTWGVCALCSKYVHTDTTTEKLTTPNIITWGPTDNSTTLGPITTNTTTQKSTTTNQTTWKPTTNNTTILVPIITTTQQEPKTITTTQEPAITKATREPTTTTTTTQAPPTTTSTQQQTTTSTTQEPTTTTATTQKPSTTTPTTRELTTTPITHTQTTTTTPTTRELTTTPITHTQTTTTTPTTRELTTTPITHTQTTTTTPTTRELTTTPITHTQTTTTTPTTFQKLTTPYSIDCLCLCRQSNYTVNEMEAKLENLKEQTTLSSTIRKRTCADDPRPSAAYMGYLGIGMLTILSLMIVLPDIFQTIKTHARLCGKH